MKKRNKPLNKTLIIQLLICAGILCAAFFVSKYHYQLLYIHGDSMYPSYKSGEIVFIDKHRKDYFPGDVVAIDCRGLDSVIVKRIDHIEPGGFYVLGDNKDASIDSRDPRVGIIKADDIIGFILPNKPPDE